MNSPFFSTKIWIEATLAGLLYVASAFFFLQTWFGVHNLNLGASEAVIPYAAAIIIAASYILGLMLHSVIPIVFRVFLPDDVTKWLRSDIPTDERNETDRSRDNVKLALQGSQELIIQIRGVYSGVVLFRLVTPGTFLFGFSLASWCMDTVNERYAPMIFALGVILSVAFVHLYREYFARYSKLELSALKALSRSRKPRRINR